MPGKQLYAWSVSDTPASALQAPPGRVGDVIYALVLGALTLLYVQPLFLAEQPALTDFGAQVIMADAWTRFDEVPQFSAYFVRETRWLPQLLPARFASLLHPLMPPTLALKWFTALGMLNTVLGAYLLARAHDRSRWLVVFCLPGLWGGMLALGLLNYCFTYGLMLESAALGRWVARRPTRGRVALLALVNVVAFFVHGLGYLLVGLLGGLGWLTSLPSPSALRRPAGWAGPLALLPGALLWLGWWRGVEADPNTLGVSMGELLREHASWRPPAEQLAWLIEQGHDLLVDGSDTALGLALFGCWLALREDPPTRPVSEPVLPSESPAETRLGEHSLLILTLTLGALMFLLPASIRGTGINSRLVTPFLFIAALLPRARPRGLPGALPLEVGVALVAAYGVHLGACMRRFEAEELAPLRALMDTVPRGSRVDCVNTCRTDDDTAIFVRRPLCSVCNGLVQTRRDGFSGGGFAQHPWNAIRYREGAGYPTVRGLDWTRSWQLPRWDYVLARGAVPSELPADLTLVGHHAPRGGGGGEWSLYRVASPVPPPAPP